MTDSSKKRFEKLIDGLKSSDREVKLMSIAALGILRIKKHSEALCDLLASPDLEILAAVIKSDKVFFFISITQDNPYH